LPFSIAASFRNELIRLVPILLPLAEKRHRRKLIVAVLALCCLVLGLIVMLTNHGDSAAGMTSYSRQQQTASSPSARSGSGITAVQAPPAIVRQQPEASWVSALKKVFLGIEDSSAKNQNFDTAPVWTDGHSGYYYCANSPYFEKLKPGSIMTQSSALQSGYQPKLGTYCQ
jgi:hypothetical protein